MTTLLGKTKNFPNRKQLGYFILQDGQNYLKCSHEISLSVLKSPMYCRHLANFKKIVEKHIKCIICNLWKTVKSVVRKTGSHIFRQIKFV